MKSEKKGKQLAEEFRNKSIVATCVAIVILVTLAFVLFATLDFWLAAFFYVVTLGIAYSPVKRSIRIVLAFHRVVKIYEKDQKANK